MNTAPCKLSDEDSQSLVTGMRLFQQGDYAIGLHADQQPTCRRVKQLTQPGVFYVDASSLEPLLWIHPFDKDVCNHPRQPAINQAAVFIVYQYRYLYQYPSHTLACVFYAASYFFPQLPPH